MKKSASSDGLKPSVMKENIPVLLDKTADGLHWLGKHQEADALSLLSALCRALKLDSLNAIETYVLSLEMSHPGDDNSTRAKTLLDIAKAAEALLAYRGPANADWVLRKDLHNALAAKREADRSGKRK